MSTKVIPSSNRDPLQQKGRSYATLQEYQARRLSQEESTNDFHHNEFAEFHAHGSISKNKSLHPKAMKSLPPPPSSYHPKRSSPRQRRRSPVTTKRRNDGFDGQYGDKDWDGDRDRDNDRDGDRDWERKRRSPTRRPRSPVNGYRKSAIQDVMRTFQCAEKNGVPTTVMSSSPTRRPKRSSNYEIHGNHGTGRSDHETGYHNGSDKGRNGQGRNRERRPSPSRPVAFEEEEEVHGHHQLPDNSLLYDDDDDRFPSLGTQAPYQKSHYRNKNGGNNDRSSPLKNLFNNPIRSCREQFTEPPVRSMKRSPMGACHIPFDDRCNNGERLFVSESEDEFLKNTFQTSPFREEDLSNVFRRSPKKKRDRVGGRSTTNNDLNTLTKLEWGVKNNGNKKGWDTAHEVPRNDPTADEEKIVAEGMKKNIRFPFDSTLSNIGNSNKAPQDVNDITWEDLRPSPSPRPTKNTNGGRESPFALNPNPKDRSMRRSRSPQLNRQRLHRSRSPVREDVIEGSSSHHRPKHKSSAKDKNKRPRKSSGRRSPSVNLLDESMEEESQPSLTPIAKDLNSGDQDKYHDSRHTTATATTTPFDPNDGDDDDSTTDYGLQDVKLTLFDNDNADQVVTKHYRADSTTQTQDENMVHVDEEHIKTSSKLDELEGEWKKSQLQIKRMLAEEVVEWFRTEQEAGSSAKEMETLKAKVQQAKNEAIEENQKRGELETENESLRNQLEHYKMQLFEQEKSRSNKFNARRNLDDDGHSCASADSSHSASTAISQHLTLKAELVNLKARLSEKEAELADEKKTLISERSFHKEEEERLKHQIQLLMKTVNNSKSKADFEVLHGEVSKLQNDLQSNKEQLEESEEYVKMLEKTMDDQLRMWQEEEVSFREEVSSLKDRFQMATEEVHRNRVMQSELTELQKKLASAKHAMKEMYNKNVSLEDERTKITKLERNAKERAEQQNEEIRVLRERNKELQTEIDNLTSRVSDIKEDLMCNDVEHKATIKKLKEQLNHAQFRVQVFKNESPKRKRNGESESDKNERIIAQLQEQLRIAEKRTEEANDSILSMQSLDHDAFEELERKNQDLTDKLDDARSRSRRIAVKSEEEIARVRQSEEVAIRKVSKFEKEATQLKHRLQRLQQNISDEAAARERIESTLRNEISLLRAEKVEAVSKSPLPQSMKTHSNKIENEMQQLKQIISTLQDLTERINKSRRKVGKESLLKLITSIDDLKTTASNVEAAAEEDKLQVENAFSGYESAVQSYECQLKDLQEKMRKFKEELAGSHSMRSEESKRAKQTEIDMGAKLNTYKLRWSNLQKEFDQYKAEASANNAPTSPPQEEKILAETNVHQQSLQPSTGKIDTGSNENKKWKMKVQHGPTRSEVEVNLREGDSLVSSMTNQSDLITSLRSIERADVENSNSKEHDDTHDPDLFAQVLDNTTPENEDKICIGQTSCSEENSFLFVGDSTIDYCSSADYSIRNSTDYSSAQNTEDNTMQESKESFESSSRWEDSLTTDGDTTGSSYLRSMEDSNDSLGTHDHSRSMSESLNEDEDKEGEVKGEVENAAFEVEYTAATGSILTTSRELEKIEESELERIDETAQSI